MFRTVLFTVYDILKVTVVQFIVKYPIGLLLFRHRKTEN